MNRVGWKNQRDARPTKRKITWDEEEDIQEDDYTSTSNNTTLRTTETINSTNMNTNYGYNLLESNIPTGTKKINTSHIVNDCFANYRLMQNSYEHHNYMMMLMMNNMNHRSQSKDDYQRILCLERSVHTLQLELESLQRKFVNFVNEIDDKIYRFKKKKRKYDDSSI